MGNFINKYLLLIVGSVILFFVFLAFLAPIAAHFGLEEIAKPIYYIYQFLCHQRPWRSIHLWDHQVAFCVRDTFIYLGMGISAFVIHFRKLRPMKWYFALLLTIPIALDGGIQTIAEVVARSRNELEFFYSSTNFLRVITGSLFGLGSGFLMFGIINETIHDEMGDKLPTMKWIKPIYYLLSVFVCLISFYTGIVQIWYHTSNKYKPSLPFDNIRIYPGVNYEVVKFNEQLFTKDSKAAHGCRNKDCKLDYEIGK